MDKLRYDRQLRLKEWGVEGQQKLNNASVAIVGCGGLGSIAAPYLAGAGIGHITLIDGDFPDISNVHRQVFFTGREQMTKAQALAQRIEDINPDVELRVVNQMLSKENIEDGLADIDVVLECSDSVLCKYLVNDFCHLENIPLVYGAIHKYEGYVSFFENRNDESIHLRDIFPLPDLEIPSCSDTGVINTIAGLIGLLQANELIKHVVGVGSPLISVLLSYNCLTNDQLKIKLRKSWIGDIEEIYEGQAYTETDCGLVPYKTISEVYKHLGAYRLISILDASEFISIAPHTERHDAEVMAELVKNPTEKKTLIYCRTGRKSRVLIGQLLREYPQLEVYNLKGGLMAYQQFKALN